jgi:hypothetical protein
MKPDRKTKDWDDKMTKAVQKRKDFRKTVQNDAEYINDIYQVTIDALEGRPYDKNSRGISWIEGRSDINDEQQHDIINEAMEHAHVQQENNIPAYPVQNHNLAPFQVNVAICFYFILNTSLILQIAKAQNPRPVMTNHGPPLKQLKIAPDSTLAKLNAADIDDFFHSIARK